MTDYVLTGLVKRRAELAGQIEATHGELRRMVDALENLDQTIRQFDPGHNVEGIRPKAFRPPKDWANRGQMSRLVLSILRQAAEPMTSQDIALEMLVTRALDRSDQRLLKIMTKRWGWRCGPSARTGWSGPSRGRDSLCFGRWRSDKVILSIRRFLYRWKANFVHVKLHPGIWTEHLSSCVSSHVGV